MRQNTPILAVLAAGLLFAAGIVGVASLAGGEPAPDDVAIRVEGVEVTFAELELRREAAAASRRVRERLLAGEDFGMPDQFLEQMRLAQEILAPLDKADARVGVVANAAASAAARAHAFESDAAPSDADLAAEVEQLLRFDERLMSDDLPNLGFPRAQREAQIAAIGEVRYREDYLPLRARDSLVRDVLLADLDVSPYEVGVVAVTVPLLAAQDADIWLHPSLGLTVEEVRDNLDQQIRVQEVLLKLSEVLFDETEAAASSD